MSEYSNIDDILVQSMNKTLPNEVPEEAAIPEIEEESQEEQQPQADNDYEESEEELPEERPETKEDDYGNEEAPERTYTEAEHKELVNRAVRDRLARIEKNTGTQATPQQQAQAQNQSQSGFEYNPDSNDSWERQLESFVEQTVGRMGQRQAQQAQEQREARIAAEFEQKFSDGMGRFSDFVEVVGHQPVTDAMTLAMRGVDNPAAFIYAASKRHPQELQRISQIQDPTRQIVEMGKLEERMRKNKTTSTAPKPLARTASDTQSPATKAKKEATIEDLIAQSDAKKRVLLNQRGGKR